jgi:MOSC domain-containing protein YiiM
VQITAIYLSPGHNFFGHYGRPAGAHDVVAVPTAECVAGRGLRGDRFFDHKADYPGQITFFSGEVHDALCEAMAIADKPPSVYRRNVITRDVDLNSLVGQEFEVQGVRFLGAAECSPCAWMDEAFAPGAEEFLRGRGGLRARILTSGPLRVDPS